MRNCTNWCLKFVQYYGVLLGYSSVIIDFKKKNFKSNRFLQTYTSLMNSVHLLMTLLQIRRHSLTIDIENGIIINLSYYLTFLSNAAVSLCVHTLRLKRDQYLQYQLKAIFSLRSLYFNKYENITNDTNLEKLLIFTVLLLIIHICNEIHLRGSILPAIGTYLVSGYIALQHLIMLYHSAILCYFNEFYTIINYQLQYDVFDKDLNLIYRHLCLLLKRFNRNYGSLIICLQFNLLATFSMTIFTTLFMFWFKEYSLFFITTLSYFVLFIHMIVYFIMCNGLTITGNNTDTILNQFVKEPYNQEVSF